MASFDEMHRRRAEVAARRRKKKKFSLLLSSISVVPSSPGKYGYYNDGNRSNRMKCAVVLAMGESSKVLC